METQFLQGNDVWNDIESFTEVQGDNVYSRSLSNKLVTFLQKEILLVKQHLPFTNTCYLGLVMSLYMLFDDTWDDLLYDFPWNWGKVPLPLALSLTGL